ncbi:hypothetical protein D3C85_1701090 [compost metagenome]
MSIQKPGRNRVKATSSSSRLSYQRLFTRKKPMVAAAKISMAMVATMKISTPCQKSTSISSRSVLKMNRNGSAAVRRL